MRVRLAGDTELEPDSPNERKFLGQDGFHGFECSLWKNHTQDFIEMLAIHRVTLLAEDDTKGERSELWCRTECVINHSAWRFGRSQTVSESRVGNAGRWPNIFIADGVPKVGSIARLMIERAPSRMSFSIVVREQKYVSCTLGQSSAT
ncbi:hypothetical protein C8R44DRAFT_811109 [Mycena epipterygia]|nr:hypothetical protein C8R44DRAFT_811109 [Mycena epipterygia]